MDGVGEAIVNDLIDNIRLALLNEQNIIPIIGFDAIPVKDGDKYVPYLDYLAVTIAKAQNLAIPPDSSGFELFNAVSHELLVHNQFDKVQTIKEIARHALAIHDLVDKTFLEKITSIFPFKYFFNLTLTSHLSEAIKANRTFPTISVSESSFPFIAKPAPKKPDDLKKSECGFVATIYNLFGSAYIDKEIRFNFFYSDDDMLAFISEFSKRYEADLINYKDAIKDSSLLFLGCQYPDWLLRILINTLYPGALNSMSSLQTKIFVDFCNDRSTIFFLSKHRLQFQRDLQPMPFIDNLYNQLSRSNFALNIDVKSDFVFVSYSRDDLDIVKKIICQLAGHMNIWFDRIKLFPGDLINNQVKTAISNCKLFLPILTLNSTKKEDRDYVKQEWIYYNQELNGKKKVIPLIDAKLNLGDLGVNLNTLFPDTVGNIFYILFNEEGLKDEDIQNLKRRI